MKRVLKTVGLTIGSIVLIFGLYMLAAYSLSRISVDREESGAGEITIFILSNGVHTDLVVPVNSEGMDWRNDFRFDDTVGKDTLAKFVGLGWGDRGFYLETPTWADLRFSVAFKADFGLGSTAIHATFFKGLQENQSCKKIVITKTQYARLVNYINMTLMRNSGGNTINIPTKANYGKDDAFYEAQGSYGLFYTCNTWANDGLKACGQKACWWTPFDTGIFYQYENK